MIEKLKLISFNSSLPLPPLPLLLLLLLLLCRLQLEHVPVDWVALSGQGVLPHQSLLLHALQSPTVAGAPHPSRDEAGRRASGGAR